MEAAALQTVGNGTARPVVAAAAAPRASKVLEVISVCRPALICSLEAVAKLQYQHWLWYEDDRLQVDDVAAGTAGEDIAAAEDAAAEVHVDAAAPVEEVAALASEKGLLAKYGSEDGHIKEHVLEKDVKEQVTELEADTVFTPTFRCPD